jgi:thioredoxin-related protein
MVAFRLNFLEEHKHSLFAKAQYFTREIDVPESPKNPDGTLVDSGFSYHYYINHYWDNMDFSDPALVTIPQGVFSDRLKVYFDEVVPPLVDSIIKYADILVEKAKNTPELFRYFVVYVTSKYERSQYVAHDAVFVHMVQKYYEKGLCTWTDEAVLERMINHANKIKNILIGKKIPELYMYDTAGVMRSNYEINKKYTIMWFWDMNCGHCKTMTPKLIEFYNRAKDSLDFEVYAVCLTTDLEKWKKTIIEKELPWINVGGNHMNIDYRQVYDVVTTPVLFVLDREKKIIVKKIGVDELENFIRHYDEGKIKY